MNLVLHLARADARRHRAAILAWIVLTVAGTLFDGQAPGFAVDRDLDWALGLSASALWLSRALLLATVVVLVVQTHPLVGSTAFWITRPIPPLTLLGSKMLLLGAVVVGVPALCEMVLMLVYRVPIGDVALVTLEWSLLRAAAVLAIMVAAALTRSFARFALAGGLLLALSPFLLNAALAFGSREAGPTAVLAEAAQGRMFLANPWQSDHTAAVVAWLLLIAGAALALRAQYRTRERARTGIIAAGTIAVAILVAFLWPWPLIASAVAPPGWAGADAVSLHGSARQSVYFDNAAGPETGRIRWRTARAGAHVQGLPDGWFAEVQPLGGVLAGEERRLEGGALVGRVVVAVPASESGHRKAIADVVGARALIARPIGSGRLPLLSLPSGQVPPDRFIADYVGTFALSLYRVEVVSAMPLQPGATAQDGAHRFVLERLESTEGGPRVLLRHSFARSVFHGTLGPTYLYYLRSRTLSEAIEGEARTISANTQAPVFPFGPGVASLFGFQAAVERIAFTSTLAARLPSAMRRASRRAAAPSDAAELEPIDAGWLQDAELLIVRTTYGGTVPRTLALKDVHVNGRP